VRYNWTSNLENLRLWSEEEAIAEVQLYYRAGGKTLVDVTNIGIGRDPRALARISRATGLNIIMGCGYYVEASNRPEISAKTEAEIADEIERDITVGVGDTGIRAGLIGEIGCSWPWTDNERKSVRAAALAQKRTGAPLLIHPGRHDSAPAEILAVLKEAGADVRRTIMAHVERTITRWETLLDLAASGCYLEYDLFGHETSYYPLANIDMPSDAQRMDQIKRLFAEGLGRQIVIALDVCGKHRLRRYGGHGYDHILERIVPRMRQRGFTEEQLNLLLVENPRRVLTFA
jgi:phosphotriesterase-related protein